MLPDEQLATVEVMRMLGLSRSAVIRRVQAGTLTASQRLPGATGAYLFLRSEVERAKAADELAVSA